MRNIRCLALSGALLAGGYAAPTFCADVGLLPAGGAGSRLGIYTYEAAVPGPGFSLELRGDQREIKAQPEKGLPTDPAEVAKIERLTAMLGLGLSRSVAVTIGMRQIKEWLNLPEVYDKDGQLVTPQRRVEGPSRLNAFYALSVRLYQNARFGLALSGFGSAYHKQKPKLADGLTAEEAYEPSYSLPLKPNYGVILHSMLRLTPSLNLYGNIGDRYHNEELVGNYALLHEPFVQTQLAWQPYRFFQVRAGFESRWLQFEDQRNRKGANTWQGHSAVSYGAAVSWAGVWLEGFARTLVSGQKNWAALEDSVGVAVGYRLGMARKVKRAKRVNKVRRVKRVGKARQPFTTGRQRVLPPARYTQPVLRGTPGARNDGKALRQPHAIKKPDPMVIGDIRDAERIAREAKRQERVRAKLRMEQEQRRLEQQRRAQAEQLRRDDQQQFPEIENLPDVTDQEYFWNGLED